MTSRRGFLTAIGSATLLAQGKNGQLVVLIGAPGSGKTTIASMIAKQYGYSVIDAADVAEKNKATLEKRRTPGLANMDLVEDPGMNALIRAELEKLDVTKGVVLDGYPTTKFQADYLAQLRKENRLPGGVVLQLDVPDEIIWKRLGGSAPIPQIQQRIKDYRRELDNAALYYPESRVVRINSNRPAEETFRDVRAAIDGKK